jgi:Ca-activated chloride channel family protein
VEVTLNQLYGGQEKFALLEVEIDGGVDGRERELAAAEVTFDDPIAGSSGRLQARQTVRFASDERKVVASANLSVQTDYAKNLTAVTKDEAVVLVDAQRRDEAARRLRARNQDLERMAKTYHNSAVRENRHGKCRRSRPPGA